MKIDIDGNELKIGDRVAFNPPRYSGLIIGEIINFSKYGATMKYKTSSDGGICVSKGVKKTNRGFNQVILVK